MIRVNLQYFLKLFFLFKIYKEKINGKEMIEMTWFIEELS